MNINRIIMAMASHAKIRSSVSIMLFTPFCGVVPDYSVLITFFKKTAQYDTLRKEKQPI